VLPLAAAAVLASCATAGRRLPLDSASAGLLIGALRFQTIMAPFPDRYGDILHLAPVSAQGEPDTDHPLSSQWAASRQVYFFNVPPGRYAVIGGSYLAHGLRYTFRLKPEYARHVLVDVRPGEVSFLGVVRVQREFQDWLVFGLNMLKSAAIVLPPWRPWTTEVGGGFRAVDATRLSEVAALTAARRDLAGTLWLPSVNTRLSRIGGPVPEPVTTGFWRRPEPAQAAETFSWIDTLQWGRPRVIPGGLEWSQPKDKALIAVRFFKEGEPGFRPLEDYRRELRGLGSIEDRHAFADVMVSTVVGQVIRYTQYVYPEPALAGSVKTVLLTEVTVVPGQGGYYAIFYRARREEFRTYLPEYLRFRGHLQLFPPRQTEEEDRT